MPQLYLEDGLEISCAPDDSLTDNDLAAKNLRRDTLKVIRAERVEHERQPGEPAPDFTVERLSADGKRTSEMFQLSISRGKAVALIFGSHT